MNKKRWLILFIICVIIGSLNTIINLIDLLINGVPLSDSQLSELAIEINKDLPRIIDTETRLDSVTALPNKILQYNQTLINISIEEVNIDDFKTTMYRKVSEFLRTNPELKFLRDKKIGVVYQYSDKNSNEILSLVFEYRDYIKFIPLSDSELSEVAKAANKNLPKFIDTETRLDSIISLSNNTLQYTITLINITKDELNIMQFKELNYPYVLEFIKTNPDMKYLRDNRIRIINLYKDKNNNEIIKLIFDYLDYKQ